MSIIKLESGDGDRFDIDMDVAKCSVILSTMVEHLGNVDDEIVPLPNISSVILQKIIDWATYHKDDPPLPEDEGKERISDDILEWDAKFLQDDHLTIFDLILAADFLQIRGLIELTSKKLANMMKGKTSEDIRRIFNIENDYTETEERELAEFTEQINYFKYLLFVFLSHFI
ncbi:S-phase kinase-associated protein 1 [Aethina tumida]|uniref:S-phase kinase-associated protein 1 n=1 Tax=Aethina tumida TaxID=116153 RepID=UPI002148B11D|nr:S-phase kinase-associated protein 1 [Aethina tumida]